MKIKIKWMQRSVFCLLFFLTPLFVYAEDRFIAQTIGGTANDSANAVIQTPDGGYVIAGSTFSFGNGGFDIYVVKYTSTGALDTSFGSGGTRTIGGVSGDQASTMIMTSNGSFVIAGTTYSFGAGDSDVYIVKLTSTGALDTSFGSGGTRTIGGTGYESISSLIQTSDGGFALMGSTMTTSFIAGGQNDMYIVKLTSTGALDTSFGSGGTRTIGGTGNDSGYSLVQASDGGYVVAGWTTSFGVSGSDYYVVKLTSTGALDTSFGSGGTITIGGSGYDYAYSIIKTSDGGYMVVGETSSNFSYGFNDMYIVKLTSTGALDTSFGSGGTRTIGSTYADTAQSVIQTSDGGYMVIGSTSSFGLGGADMYIVKLTSTGALDTSFDSNGAKTIGGGSNNDYAYSIIQTSDNNYVIAGSIRGFGAGASDAYIARFTSTGKMGGCSHLRSAGGSISSGGSIGTGSTILGGGGTASSGGTTSSGGTFSTQCTAYTPVISQITPVSSPTNDNTPAYTFDSNVVGSIAYGGACDGSTYNAIVGNNTISFDTLSDGSYANCQILVKDDWNSDSNILTVNTFTVDTTPPTLTQVTAVPSPTNDNTPSYTFQSSDDVSGHITYSGACGTPVVENKIEGMPQGGGNPVYVYNITYDTLSDETYDDCTIVAQDSLGNTSSTLAVNTFIVDTTPAIAQAISVTPDNYLDISQGGDGFTFYIEVVDAESGGGELEAVRVQMPSGAFADANAGASAEVISGGTRYSYGYSIPQGNEVGTGHISVDISNAAGTETTIENVVTLNFVESIDPILTQVTAVPSPTNDATPNYTFNTTEAGTIIYGGDCSSATTTATAGDNTITLNSLSSGTYSNCTITVTDSFNNASNVLAMNTFTVDTTPPTLTQVTAVPSPTNDNTPSYVFNLSEQATYTIRGERCLASWCTQEFPGTPCSDYPNTVGNVGEHTIDFWEMADDVYDDCTISATDNVGNHIDFVIPTFTVDTTPPTLTQVTAVPTPTNDPTPNYTFNTTEAGTIIYGGDCSSTTSTATVGDNTITFSELSNGAYENCTIEVFDASYNFSGELTVSTFTVNAVAPVLTEVTPVPTPTTDTTPEYTFNSTKSGVIHYGGECESSTALAVVGNNTIIFNELPIGTYDDCVIAVEDADENMSEFLQVNTFVITSQEGNTDSTEEKEIPKPDFSFSGKIKDAVLSSKKKLYVKNDEIKFKGEYPEIVGGKVVITYKKGSDDEEEAVDVDQNGNWSKKIEFDEDGSYKIKFTFFDKDGNKIGEKGYYKIKIDTEDPKLSDMPSKLTKRVGDKIWWNATDNGEVDEYKYYFNGKKEKTDDPFFYVPKDTPKGTYILEIRAYDKAGNKDVKHVTIVVR